MTKERERERGRKKERKKERVRSFASSPHLSCRNSNSARRSQRTHYKIGDIIPASCTLPNNGQVTESTCGRKDEN